MFAFNKPRGVISTMSDDEGRPCVGDWVAGRTERLFHVGRLDADTEGLLILTNDGELANRLGHPSHEVDKTYVATVRGQLLPPDLRALKEGVELEDGLARADSVRIVQKPPDRTLVELVIHEGRNRIVRRMLAEVGLPGHRSRAHAHRPDPPGPAATRGHPGDHRARAALALHGRRPVAPPRYASVLTGGVS